MTNTHLYCYNSRVHCHSLSWHILNRACLVFFILCIIFFKGLSQQVPKNSRQTELVFHAADTVHVPQPGEYDELMITLNVPRIGSIEIPAVIYNEIAFLPVKELFDFL